MAKKNTVEKNTASRQQKSVAASMSGMRLSVDFISPIIVGIFMGFWLDRWSDTTPIFLLIFFFLGTLAGFWNLYRMAQKIEKQNNAQN